MAAKWKTISFSSKTWVLRYFRLPVGSRTYRMVINISRKLISRWFWTYSIFTRLRRTARVSRLSTIQLNSWGWKVAGTAAVPASLITPLPAFLPLKQDRLVLHQWEQQETHISLQAWSHSQYCRNISFSFDPTSLTCNSCQGEAQISSQVHRRGWCGNGLTPPPPGPPCLFSMTKTFRQ